MRTRAAAVALIFCPYSRGDRELLFIQRTVSPRDPWSGQISLPGGRRDSGDEDLLATALRETREETGVRLKRTDMVGRLPDLHPGGTGLPKMVIRPFVFKLSKKPMPRPGHEADHAFWGPLRALARSDGKVSIDYRGRKIRVSAFVHEKRVIWGITRRILISFFTRGPSLTPG